ncbi:MAG: type I glyceraldehyde-3-phosphate dehydrogenase [Synergistales bacterium]|nr:type I glyceraldehyde-3-phosphate dehydrogenase [Synergistales bacterium]
MEKTRVAINGFGRIGRLTLRSFFEEGSPEGRNFEVVAINDLTSPDNLTYLFKYDSVHRRFGGSVESSGDEMVINGKRVKVLAEPDPSKLPWKEMGVDIVVESTGRFVEADKAKAHLDAGAKKVLISAPAKQEDLTVVLGVNEEHYDPSQHRIVSNASCTTNCLAPLVKVLHDSFGVEKGVMTTAHSYTNDQKILDFPHSKYTRGRAAALSIIPTTTGAAKAIGKVMPEMQGKMTGMAMRVPTPDVSIVDLSVEVSRDTDRDAVNAAMKAAAEGPLRGILAYEEEDLVSADFVGDSHSAIFIPQHTMVIGNLVKVLGWYDNEWGYSCRINDFVDYMVSKGV